MGRELIVVRVGVEGRGLSSLVSTVFICRVFPVRSSTVTQPKSCLPPHVLGPRNPVIAECWQGQIIDYRSEFVM